MIMKRYSGKHHGKLAKQVQKQELRSGEVEIVRSIDEAMLVSTTILDRCNFHAILTVTRQNDYDMAKKVSGKDQWSVQNMGAKGTKH